MAACRICVQEGSQKPALSHLDIQIRIRELSNNPRRIKSYIGKIFWRIVDHLYMGKQRMANRHAIQSTFDPRQNLWMESSSKKIEYHWYFIKPLFAFH